jgi:WD repeat-containing protein 19
MHSFLCGAPSLQAAKTAVIIGRQEQDLGNYKVAHSILFETYRDLRTQNIRVPQTLARALLLLHSYLLVKRLVRRGDHDGAARMLIRVSRSISKFPTHVVPILTTTVIECQRARLKKSGASHAPYPCPLLLWCVVAIFVCTMARCLFFA